MRSPLKNTPVKRDARLVRGRDRRAVERGRVEVRAPAGWVLLQLYVEALSVHPDDDGAEPRPRVELPGQRPRRVGLVATPAKARQSREPRAAGRDGGRGSRPSRLQCGERGRGRQTLVDAQTPGDGAATALCIGATPTWARLRTRIRIRYPPFGQWQRRLTSTGLAVVCTSSVPGPRRVGGSSRARTARIGGSRSRQHC